MASSLSLQQAQWLSDRKSPCQSRSEQRGWVRGIVRGRGWLVTFLFSDTSMVTEIAVQSLFFVAVFPRIDLSEVPTLDIHSCRKRHK